MSLGAGFEIKSPRLLLLPSLCSVLVGGGVSSRLPVSAALPATCSHEPMARWTPIPSGVISPISPSFYKLLLVMVFYHSNRAISNTTIKFNCFCCQLD